MNKISLKKTVIKKYTSFLSKVFFLLCFSTLANAQPNITTLSPDTQYRSGFLEITGIGFGTNGEVTIGSQQAITTTWNDTRIAAYIPEASNFGVVDVVVTNVEGTSNVLTVNVIQREQVGRVKWRLRIDALYSSVRPARGLNGTIYAVDVYNRLYAVSPDGALLWVVLNAGDKGVSVGVDGTIYTGTNEWVKAFNPDGSEKWTYTQNPRAFIYLDTRVGPDGNIYAATSSGMGVFSLDPDGNLLWATPEAYSRPIVTYTELAFGFGDNGYQLYFEANGHVRSLALEDGAEIFVLPSFGVPVVSPLDDTVHLGASAYTPSGNLLWQFQFPFNSISSSTPAVSINGISYVSHQALNLFALDPYGNALWDTALPEYSSVLDVDPADNVVLTQSDNTLSHVGFIQGRRTTNGSLLWHLELPIEQPEVANSWTGTCGFNQYVDSKPVFTPDNGTFYVMTAIASGNIVEPRGFLYAIDTDPSIPPVSTILRSEAITITTKTRRGQRTISSQVDVVDENRSSINDATIYVTWTLPDGSTIDQVSLPSGGGGKGKKGGGGGGNGSVQFSIPDTGTGIYKLTVTNMTKDGYTADVCNGVLSHSVYL